MDIKVNFLYKIDSRSQWPRGLRRRSSAARMLRLWVRIPPRQGCLSVLSVVCCQVEVSATDDHLYRGVIPTVARRYVWSRNLGNEEAKARYRAVKIQPQWVVTPGKRTNKNQSYKIDNRAHRKHVDCNGTGLHFSTLLLAASDSLDL
jgi:hypothetical protein